MIGLRSAGRLSLPLVAVCLFSTATLASAVSLTRSGDTGRAEHVAALTDDAITASAQTSTMTYEQALQILADAQANSAALAPAGTTDTFALAAGGPAAPAAPAVPADEAPAEPALQPIAPGAEHAEAGPTYTDTYIATAPIPNPSGCNGFVPNSMDAKAVTAKQSGMLYVQINGYTGNWDVAVIDQTGKRVAFAATANATSQSLQTEVSQGQTFTIQACNAGGTSSANVKYGIGAHQHHH